jgi:hypothetical protein
MAIPGNDDSLDSMIFYNTHLSQYILEKKFSYISSWFLRIRKKKRFLNFKDWILKNYFTLSGKFNKNKLKNKKKNLLQYLNSLKYKFILNKNLNINNKFFGLRFYFFKNYGINAIKEQLDIFNFNSYLNINKSMQKFIYFFKKCSIYLSKALNFYFIKGSWNIYNYIKKQNLMNKKFKLMFLTGFYYDKYNNKDLNIKNFFSQRFLQNKIFKTLLKRNYHRFSIFVLKFIKFFYIKKFNEIRGFMNIYSQNLIYISSFFFLSISYCSFLFIKNIYNPLLNNNIINKKYIKINPFIKYSFLKKNINIFFSKLINNNIINNYLKFILSLKIFSTFNMFIKKKIKLLFNDIFLFFNFFFYNRKIYPELKIYHKMYFSQKWMELKSIKNKYMLLKFLNKSLISYNKFKHLFIKKFNDFQQMNNYMNNYSSNLNIKLYKNYFNIFNKNYLKTFINYNENLKYIYNNYFWDLNSEFGFWWNKNFKIFKNNDPIFKLNNKFSKNLIDFELNKRKYIKLKNMEIEYLDLKDLEKKYIFLNKKFGQNKYKNSIKLINLSIKDLERFNVYLKNIEKNKLYLEREYKRLKEYNKKKQDLYYLENMKFNKYVNKYHTKIKYHTNYFLENNIIPLNKNMPNKNLISFKFIRFYCRKLKEIKKINKFIFSKFNYELFCFNSNSVNFINNKYFLLNKTNNLKYIKLYKYKNNNLNYYFYKYFFSYFLDIKNKYNIYNIFINKYIKYIIFKYFNLKYKKAFNLWLKKRLKKKFNKVINLKKINIKTLLNKYINFNNLKLIYKKNNENPFFLYYFLKNIVWYYEKKIKVYPLYFYKNIMKFEENNILFYSQYIKILSFYYIYLNIYNKIYNKIKNK